MKSKLRMVISIVKKYNGLLSLSCRVGDLSLSFSCHVGEYFFVSVFVCELTFGQLSVGELSHNEKIVTMWPTNDLITLTRKGSRGVGAQPPLFNKQNVKV